MPEIREVRPISKLTRSQQERLELDRPFLAASVFFEPDRPEVRWKRAEGAPQAHVRRALDLRHHSADQLLSAFTAAARHGADDHSDQLATALADVARHRAAEPERWLPTLLAAPDTGVDDDLARALLYRGWPRTQLVAHGAISKRNRSAAARILANEVLPRWEERVAAFAPGEPCGAAEALCGVIRASKLPLMVLSGEAQRRWVKMIRSAGSKLRSTGLATEASAARLALSFELRAVSGIGRL